MEGDICTFNVVETTLWHVIITRWKEKINQSFYCLPLSFCKAIGLRELYTITLKTSMSSTSWLVRVFHYPNCSMVSGSGWTGFCHENRISVGDVCTFEIIETTQWHVIIERPEASTK
nr:unnamed protein product [Digitaria exilis]